MNKRKKNGIKGRITWLILSVGTFIGVFYYSVVINTHPYPTIIPSSTPELHEYALTIPVNKDETGQMDVPIHGGGASVTCSSAVNVQLKKSKIDFYYKNPSRSLSSALVQILVNDQVLAQSGAIPPGYESYVLDLNTDVKWKVGQYKGTLIISFYDLNTNKKVDVDSQIEIDVFIEK